MRLEHERFMSSVEKQVTFTSRRCGEEEKGEEEEEDVSREPAVI